MNFYHSIAAGNGARRGFSMPEVLASVLVIGILSAIMIPQMMNAKTGSEEIVANEVVETMNAGVTKFNQIAHKIETAAGENSITDEQEVLGFLQTRDVTIPGSPFVRPDWNPIESPSTEDYRIEWAGRTFRLLKPGTAGTGLKVNFEAEDYN